MSFDVAADGRFIMIRDLSNELSPDELILVEGWFQELESLTGVP